MQIEIGGKVRGVKFNQFAFQEYSLNYVRYDKIAERYPELFFVYTVIYAGLAGFCIQKTDDVDFTFTDIVEWVDELYEQKKR